MDNFAGMKYAVDTHLKDFILEHEKSDLSELLLHRERYPDIDMDTAAKCIQGRAKARTKLPLWHAEPCLVYPNSLSLEQCSSQATALYKRRFVNSGDIVADLTGGLGVDSWSLSMTASAVDYYERSEELCECAGNNFRILGRDNIAVSCICTDLRFLSGTAPDRYSLIYIDPARRGKNGSRVYSLKDCEPDITSLRHELLRIAPRVLVKVSPMADIRALVAELPETAEIHVLSHNHECKEILILMLRGMHMDPDEIPVTVAEPDSGECPSEEPSAFRFTLREEKDAEAVFAVPSEIGGYLYEPSPGLLKSGAFKLPAVRFGLRKISASTHYYTGDSVHAGFPGKIRKITEVLPFNRKVTGDFRKAHPECSVTCRNFPMTSEQLRKRLGTSESSTVRALATTLSDGSRAIILTEQRNSC